MEALVQTSDVTTGPCQFAPEAGAIRLLSFVNVAQCAVARRRNVRRLSATQKCLAAKTVLHGAFDTTVTLDAKSSMNGHVSATS